MIRVKIKESILISLSKFIHSKFYDFPTVSDWIEALKKKNLEDLLK